MGSEEPITVKYDPNFDKHHYVPFNFYYGASLAALTKLAHAKGYILVGCESTGTNAFFIRQDAAAGKFTDVPVSKAFFPLARRCRVMNAQEQFERLRQYDFERV